MQHLCKRYLTIKAGVKLFERSLCGVAGGIRRNFGHDSLRSIVTSGGPVLEGFFVGKACVLLTKHIIRGENKCILLMTLN